MAMTLLAGEDQKRDQQKNVADQRADGEVGGEADARLESRGEEVVRCWAGEAAGYARWAAVAAIWIGEGGAEAGGDVW